MKTRRKNSGMRRVLVTGAAGNIGPYFAQHAAEQYNLRLMTREGDDPQLSKSLKNPGDCIVGDVTDLSSMRQACEGIDTVVHLAGDPSPSATWESLRQANIVQSIEARNVNFAIVHGLSDNRFKRMDISDARQLLGYNPQDDLTQSHPRLRKLHLRKVVRAHSAVDADQKSGIRRDVARAKRI